MATTQTEAKPTAKKTAKTAAGAATEKGVLGRRKLRKIGREKRKLKLQSDKEFATTFFAAKSKRAADKKVAFRKRKAKK